MNRSRELEKLKNQHDFDVVLLGAGINGACLYDTLCKKGYRVVLIDKGDFSSGTSQASGMMIWGGLLYLKNLELATVLRFCNDRDRMIREKPDWVTTEMMQYLPSQGIGRSRLWVQAGLWFYWLLGMGHRHVPRLKSQFSELHLIRPHLAKRTLAYEEAVVKDSDARFVFRWLEAHQGPDQIALNYATIQAASATFNERWHLDVTDNATGKHYPIRSKMIVNCTGIWVDQVNANFRIQSPFRHALSKGVYLGLPRSSHHKSTLIFDLGEHSDVITLVPWGPIALWGPTETAVHDIESGTNVSQDEIDYLLDHYTKRFRVPITRSDIVSVRCGIRPLVVSHDYKNDRYPLELSRRQEVHQDAERPWISCYGGKLTGCSRMAMMAHKLIERTVSPSGRVRPITETRRQPPEQVIFPSLDQPVTAATWSLNNESCTSLDDYLRRRTNISQWVPRQGLGHGDANESELKEIALDLAHGDERTAMRMYEEYRNHVVTNFDTLLTTS